MRPYYIMGGSKISSVHVEAIQHNQNQLFGISSRNPTVRAGDMTHLQSNMGPKGQKLDLQEGYQHHTDLCHQMRSDGIVICTLPTDMHYSAGCCAALHNRHCLMEKPFCSQSTQASDLIEAYQASAGRLAVNHILPLFPAYKYFVKKLRGQGEGIQQLTLIRFTDRAETKNADWVEAVGGNAPDLLAHDGHLAIMCFGMPGAVVVDKAEFMYDVPVYMELRLLYPHHSVQILCGSPPESRAFHASFSTRLKDGTSLCLGEKGLLLNDQPVSLEDMTPSQVFAAAHTLFEQFIAGERKCLGPLRPLLALQTVQLIQACVTASRTIGKQYTL